MSKIRPSGVKSARAFLLQKIFNKIFQCKQCVDIEAIKIIKKYFPLGQMVSERVLYNTYK